MYLCHVAIKEVIQFQWPQGKFYRLVGFCVREQLHINTLWIFNTLRPRQNGRHFAEDIFKHIFLNENIWISIEISLKIIPNGSIYNKSALVQIMA